MMGKYDDAEIQTGKAERFSPTSKLVRTFQAWLLAVRRDKTNALKLIEDEEDVFKYEITMIYAILGLKDEAILNINKGIEIGFFDRGMYFYSYPYLLHNPFYDNLRDDPCFQKIIQQEKVKYEEKLRKYGEL